MQDYRVNSGRTSSSSGNRARDNISVCVLSYHSGKRHRITRTKTCSPRLNCRIRLNVTRSSSPRTLVGVGRAEDEPMIDDAARLLPRSRDSRWQICSDLCRRSRALEVSEVMRQFEESTFVRISHQLNLQSTRPVEVVAYARHHGAPTV